jgi:outer membrane protein assembly factor BamB
MSPLTPARAAAPAPRTPLRLWPGVTAVVLAVLVTVFLPIVAPRLGLFAIAAGAAGGLLILVWWLFFSRAPWAERLGALVLMVVGAFATSFLVHQSLATGLYYVFVIPAMTFALVAWAAGTRRLGRAPRLAWLAPAIGLGCLALMAVRLNGVSNTQRADLAWRWTPTAEEQLLAQLAKEPAAIHHDPASKAETEIASETEAETEIETESDGETADQSEAETATENAVETDTDLPVPHQDSGAPSTAPRSVEPQPEWPGFRGPNRDGVVHGSRIATDWSQSPPVELWRRAIGPAWSSFAVAGDRVYTQEQLGENETVSCYDLRSGAPVWRHGDPVRFWEAAGGAGPRATPTLHDGRVYSLGATGVLNALDATDGSVVWSRDVPTDAQKSVPFWGFAGSPLVVGDALIIGAAGKLVSYDLATGDLRWIGPKGSGYSSPQAATIDGVEQILILNGPGVVSVEPADGRELWKYERPGDSIVQPSVMDDGSVLVGGNGSGMGSGEPGLRHITVTRGSGEWSAERGAGGWTVEESWTSNGLKPYFSDFVLHRGHAYGFDGAILASIDLADGSRKWKGGRYGNGQLVLLADQDLLLVLSEKGELALVDASPAQFTERARFKAIDGKTWNHPAVAGDIVLVRNSEEMAAFRVSPAGG